jgi:hypothetical protein
VVICGGAISGVAYFAQARAAAWNSGEDIAPLSLKALMALGEPVGSGKFKTPCDRTHLANSTSSRTRSPLEDGPPVVAAPAGTAVVVVASLATPALVEPLPQASAARERPMTAEATSISRRRSGLPMPNTPAARRQRRLLGSPWSRACGWFIERTVRKT